MQLNPDRVKKYLDSFAFEDLFIEEVGWNYSDEEDISLNINSENYHLHPVADGQGLVVYRCSPNAEGIIPVRPIRRAIEKQLTKQKMEHLIIFCDEAETEQIWQRVRRETGKPEVCREIKHIKGRSGTLLIEKLNAITFTMEQFMEDAEITIIQATQTVDQAFALEDQVTRSFYDKFKKQRELFMSFINGLPDEQLSWYSSVMMNRLMFIYFIQKKAFRDNNGCLYNDHDYLHNRLRQSQQDGPDLYYRHFLQPLFFGGFACPKDKRTPKDIQLLGDVPYLNGGLFMKHEIEINFPDIDIADQAFENVFNFFEGFNWRLDERPIVEGNEINPDILGYIFEKYINQKQMGAYYTKEDITEYISKNTIIPFLFDEVQRKLPQSFSGDDSVFNILAENPARYIYPPMLKGMELELPENIAKGINDISLRGGWNTLAPEQYALPTEIWREVITRRQRCAEIMEKMQAGEIKSINDLITYNLNIRQFAQDVIENSDDPQLIRAFYYTLAGRIPRKSNEAYQRGMSILDPTCGSGAFLFAALNILEPLYEACLDRMLFLLEETQEKGSRADKLQDFREIIQLYQRHRNRRYSILKSIIVQNLYGVDIMPEAVEICKLRLFLKLVAQVEEANELEPLPDIDFNIKTGNTLVGFTSYQEVENSIKNSPNIGGLFDDPLTAIKERLEEVDRMFLLFQKMQSGHFDHQFSSSDYTSTKQQLKARLLNLEKELNEYLAGEYGIDARNTKNMKQYEHWLNTHQPFHWLVEFYGIMEKNMGFDVIIGNPPYVEYSKVRKNYRIMNYTTESCGNLYSYTVERSVFLLNGYGKVGLIVPISITCTQRMHLVQQTLNSACSNLWFSSYAERPSKLFAGAEILITIIIGSKSNSPSTRHSTTFIKWTSSERLYLFNLIRYEVNDVYIKDYVIPKAGLKDKRALKNSLLNESDFIIYYRIGGGRYWKIFTNFRPYFQLNGEISVSSRENYLYAQNTESRNVIISVLSSSLFYWYFILTTNCRDLNPSDLKEFPINIDGMKRINKVNLDLLCRKLMDEYTNKSAMKSKTSSKTGKIVYQEFYPRLSKPIIDEIDKGLAQHYGFTDEELDFIVNYDIKYRMGLNGSVDKN